MARRAAWSYVEVASPLAFSAGKTPVTHLRGADPPEAVCVCTQVWGGGPAAWVTATSELCLGVLTLFPHWALPLVRLQSVSGGTWFSAACGFLFGSQEAVFLRSLLFQWTFPSLAAALMLSVAGVRSLWKLFLQRRAARTPVLPSPKLASHWPGQVFASLCLSSPICPRCLLPLPLFRWPRGRRDLVLGRVKVARVDLAGA